MVMPNYGYKYCKWDKYARRIITHQELYFNNPLMFNDIFDCQAYGTIGDLMPENYSWTDKKDRQVRRAIVDILCNLHEDIADGISKFGVCCFSKKYNNILMWSHYADYHRGICFKFDLDKISTNGCFSDIQYVRSKPHFDFTNPNDDPFKWFFYKSTIWRYEQEIRSLIIPPLKAKSERYRKVHFPKEALKEIIFGVDFLKGNARGDSYGSIIGLCQDNGFDVKFSVMQTNKLTKEYKLRKAPMTIIKTTTY